MQREICYATPPRQTRDLVASLTLPPDKIGEKESNALNALKSQMVFLFKDDPRSLYWEEAALLTTVASLTEFKDLVQAFSTSITDGIADGKPIDHDLLKYFSACLRWSRHSIPSSEARFGSVLAGLSKHLANAGQSNELSTTYLLLRAIGTLLDAMVDIKVSDLDHEALHGPLTKRLYELGKHDEPRIAQAAKYASQALSRVPDDEGPWEKFFRVSGIAVNVTAQIAGAVGKLDPQQFLEAGPDLLKLAGLFSSAVKGGKEIWDTREDLKQMIAAMRDVSMRKGWYDALRQTDIFIQHGAYDGLGKALPQLNCLDKSEFWTGLYSQLETRWISHPSSQQGIESFIEWTFTEQSLQKVSSKSDSIQSWVGLLADSVKNPQWKEKVPKRRKFRSHFMSERSPPQLKTMPHTSQSNYRDSSRLLICGLAGSKETRVFYADAIVAQHYTNGPLLHIKRLSGDPVSIDDCYINLSLIEDNVKDKEAAEFSLQNRLRVEAPISGKSVTLETLFRQRKLRGENEGVPSRILIRGRAGIGKTTLCKKIVHDFLHQNMWGSAFDRIIWVQLRRLRGYNDFDEFLRREIFGKNPRSGELLETFNESTHDRRTLFVLDGLDEILGVQRDGGSLIECFQHLLNRQNVILTSRPYAVFPSRLKEYDLEIETVGFQDMQIDAYIDKVCVDEQSKKIKQFIAQHWVIKTLMRIPIQLDAVCYTWDERLIRNKPLTTMSSLYKAIEIRLWQKDLARSKQTQGLQTANCITRSQICSLNGDLVEFIQYIAFLGLYNNISVFTWDIRELIYDRFPKMTDDHVYRNSFLRSSDSLLGPRYQDYYFLHLTFQEYFAANHFVKSWGKDQDIFTINLETGKSIFLKPRDFISREKYNGRYNIMWRFVTGILSESLDLDLLGFLNQLESKPRDLIGNQHLRILMNCFGEIKEREDELELKQMRTSMENQLAYHRLLDRFHFPAEVEMEFPEHIPLEALKKGDTEQRKVLLKHLGRRDTMSETMLDCIFDIFQSPKHYDITQVEASNARAYAAAVIAQHGNDTLSENVCKTIFANGEFLTGSYFIDGLKIRPDISDNILRIMVGTSSPVRDRSLMTMVPEVLFSKCPKVPESIISILLSHLSDNSRDVRSWAARALESSTKVPAVFEHLVAALDDPDEGVVDSCCYALQSHSDLPLALCEKLVSIIDDWESQSAKASGAISLLKVQSVLPIHIIEKMWSFLETSVLTLPQHAFHILKFQGSVSSGDIIGRYHESKRKDRFVISVIREACQHDLTVPDCIIEHCLSIATRPFRLSHTSESSGTTSDVSSELALDVLRRIDNLPTHAIDMIWERYNQPESIHVISVFLSEQKDLADYIVNEIGRRILERVSPDETNDLIMSLYRQNELPVWILDAIVSFILDRESDDDFPLQLLLNQPWLPSHILERLAPILRSKYPIHLERSCSMVLWKHGYHETFLPRVESEFWVSIFLKFVRDWYMGDSLIFFHNNHLHVRSHEGSLEVNIAPPEQRLKLEAALDAIDLYLEEYLETSSSSFASGALRRRDLI